MSNILTQSRLRAARDCAFKHRLLYVEGFRPAVEAEALHVGTLTHLGLAAWWSATNDRLPAALAAVAGRARDAFAQVLVEELLAGYDSFHGGRDEYETLLVEAPFTAPLINPDTGAASRTWVLGGKVDVIARERRTGRVLLIEHKTASESIEHDGTDYFLKLAMDGQISHYVIGAEALGHRVEACVYDALRKPGQRPLKATPVESRRYTKAGTLDARHREHDETPQEYRERIRGVIAGEPSAYFHRREVPRLESQLVAYLADVWADAQKLRQDEQAGRASRNPDACDRYSRCAFWDVCANGIRPEEHPEMYVRVEDVHPELEVSAKQG